ncbi:MAG: PAC2 family protein [Candidatus Bathyarchaeota archaeon]|nr:PAC2 family protein [Candidatus Bathyarchaeum tardum]WGM90025.1 MAG: PAC2 family protein [Candidatus Bathyarchaeum tardum]WNZ29833.1 MAG: PAC2 family protein [Candidatus Bathyarchaeota archaeon]
MDKPYFRELFEPQLENPILVEGLAGLGNIGMIAACHLIECTDAKPFAEVYAPYFPDYVTVNKEGICRPPRYRFYVAKTEKSHFIILTGDAQPSMEDGLAHYDISDEILNFAAKYGTKRIVTLGGVATSNAADQVYIAATSDSLAQKHLDKGTTIYSEGKIAGATGLLIGLAKKRGWKGICLLGATSGFGTERAAALSIYKVLQNILESDTKTLETKPEQKSEG